MDEQIRNEQAEKHMRVNMLREIKPDIRKMKKFRGIIFCTNQDTGNFEPMVFGEEELNKDTDTEIN